MLRTSDNLLSADLHERDSLGVARFEADRGPGRYIEALEKGLFAVKGKGAVRLAEMEMRADLRRRTWASVCTFSSRFFLPVQALTLDQTRTRTSMSKAYLNGPISSVGHLEPDPLPPFVDPDRFLADHDCSGDFFIFEPMWFVSPFREHSLGREGQERAVQGEREVVVDRGRADRVVDRHEKDAVREGALDLNFVQQERDCLQGEKVSARSATMFFFFLVLALRTAIASFNLFAVLSFLTPRSLIFSTGILKTTLSLIDIIRTCIRLPLIISFFIARIFPGPYEG